MTRIFMFSRSTIIVSSMATFRYFRTRPLLYGQIRANPCDHLSIGASDLLMPSLQFSLVSTGRSLGNKVRNISSTRKLDTSRLGRKICRIRCFFDEPQIEDNKATDRISRSHQIVADEASKDGDGRAWHAVMNTLKASRLEEVPAAYQSTSLSLASAASSVKYPSQLQLPSVDQMLFLAGILSCMTLGTLLALLATAIPTLFAMRKAALSMEKLAIMAIEELPSTMAAMRLSSMEISDLTLELHGLSQEISEGVKSSARAVKAAEVGVRQMGAFAASQTLAILQERASVPVAAVKPVVASAAETTRQAVAQAQKAVANIASQSYTFGWFRKVTQKSQPEGRVVTLLDLTPHDKIPTSDENKDENALVDAE